MKRSKLYELVWSKPMTKLGAELGILDVGLAKACRRHAIPVPPRGHWAKLQAGKRSPRVRLAQPDLDIDVSFTTVPPAQRQADVARQREAKAVVAEKTEALRAAAPARKEARTRLRISTFRALRLIDCCHSATVLRATAIGLEWPVRPAHRTRSRSRSRR